jgi:hypothetical protein
MIAPHSDFPQPLRRALLPYCLKRLPDGSYVALNRDYKPVGSFDRGYVRYEDHPVRFKFARKLSAATIRALSCDGSENAEAIHFYNDGCVPFSGSPKTTYAYLKRLERLAGLRVRPSIEFTACHGE